MVLWCQSRSTLLYNTIPDQPIQEEIHFISLFPDGELNPHQQFITYTDLILYHPRLGETISTHGSALIGRWLFDIRLGAVTKSLIKHYEASQRQFRLSLQKTVKASSFVHLSFWALRPSQASRLGSLLLPAFPSRQKLKHNIRGRVLRRRFANDFVPARNQDDPHIDTDASTQNLPINLILYYLLGKTTLINQFFRDWGDQETWTRDCPGLSFFRLVRFALLRFLE